MSDTESEVLLGSILARARCILWFAAIRKSGDRRHWDFAIPAEEAAQHVVPLHVEPGARYTDAWLASRHPDDRARMEETSANALRWGLFSYHHEFRIRNRYGAEQWLYEDVSLEPTDAGRWEAVGICTDVTDLHRAEAKYRSIFENAVEGIFQTTADGAYLTANPALARIYGYESPQELVDSVTDIRRQLYVDPEQRARFVQLLQSHDTVSGFEAQIRRKDGRILWISESARAVRDDRGALLYYEGTVEEITARKRAEEERAQAKAIEDHLRLALEQERDIVQILTEGFLRKSPEIPGYGVAYYYRPCVEADRAGGDWFDFLRIDGRRYGVAIGDVAGKGISAAVYTAKTRHMLQAYAVEDPTPARVVERLNRALYAEMSDRGLFVTLLYGLLDLEAGKFTYTNAGHSPPVLYDPATGGCGRLAVTGGFVGGIRDMAFGQEAVPIAPGSIMALFTDGIIEAVGQMDPYHDGGVGDLLVERAGESAESIAGAIMARSRRLAAQHRTDDMAVIVLKRQSDERPDRRRSEKPSSG